MILRFLYETVPGRCVLRVLTNPVVSWICGMILDSPVSTILIPFFVKVNHIDMKEYRREHYRCFNDFFCRHVRAELRPVDPLPEALIAPCDGLLSAYPIQEGLVIPVKQSRYRMADLLRDSELAAEFEGGTCLVFRLCVDHYHRYCYPDSGRKGENISLPGILHTVRPIALRESPVFTENAREYTILETDHFGRMVQMEVGAMLVGKIANEHGAGPIRRGQEKGHFLYGGSTIILLIRKGEAEILPAYLRASEQSIESPVKLGQRIGLRRKGLSL